MLLLFSHLSRYLDLATIKIFKCWYQVDAIFKLSRSYNELKKFEAGVNKFADSLAAEIEREYQTGMRSADRQPQIFLDHLYKIRDTMTYDEIRDEWKTFILAGYDTSGKVKKNILNNFSQTFLCVLRRFQVRFCC